MAENKVLMDTNVFTDIVNDIKSTSDDCILSDSPLGNLSVWEGLDIGLEMNDILKHIYDIFDELHQETSADLPRGLLTLRDSMIEQDRIASEGLTVNVKK